MKEAAIPRVPSEGLVFLAKIKRKTVGRYYNFFHYLYIIVRLERVADYLHDLLSVYISLLLAFVCLASSLNPNQNTHLFNNNFFFLKEGTCYIFSKTIK